MTNMVSKAENDAAGAQAWTVAEAKAKLGEVIERALSDGSRRKRLDEWLRNELPLRFEGRLLAIEAADADDRGEVIARREAQGKPTGAMDAVIAALARTRDLTLDTRNAADFEPSVKAIINPWSRG